MKTQIVIVVFAIIANTLSAQKVDSTLAHLPYQNVLRVTPLQFIWGKMSAAYERGISQRTTANMELQLWKEDYSLGWGFPLGVRESYTNTGYRVSASLRFYPEAAFQGFYTQVGIFTGKHDITTSYALTIALLPVIRATSVFDDVWSSGAKVGIGYHVMVGHLSFDMGLGFGLAAPSNSEIKGNSMEGVFLTSRLGVGLAF